AVPCLCTSLSAYNASLEWQLVCGQAKGFACNFFSNAGKFEHNTPGFDVGNPELWGAFTRTHTNFGWFLCQWTIWENVDPDVTSTFDVPIHRATGFLDLTVPDICAAGCLQSQCTERYFGAALGHTFTTWTVLLTVFCPTWDKH